MSNHVHFIFYKLDRDSAKMMQSLKGYTGFKTNKILLETIPERKAGTSFWQDESFDRSIRNRIELKRRSNYVLNNPVKIGLIKHWKDWKWSYIHSDFLSFVD
jgi:putative transposase